MVKPQGGLKITEMVSVKENLGNYKIDIYNI